MVLVCPLPFVRTKMAADETAHWGIEDPAAVEGTDIEKQRVFNEDFRYLRNRIAAFTSLPLKSIGKLALSARLNEIGRMEGSTSSPARAKTE